MLVVYIFYPSMNMNRIKSYSAAERSLLRCARPNLFILERLKKAVQEPRFHYLAEKIGVMGEAQ